MSASSSLSNGTLYIFLNDLTSYINRYCSIFIFLFGIIGNLLNILVLSQRTLRSNPCAWLFLSSSIANLITILAAITTRILAGWAADPTDTIGWLCKLRGFMIYHGRTVAYWLLMLASLDRWFISHSNISYRQQSTIKNVRKGTLLIFILSTVLYADILYCYEANLINTPLKCYSKTTLCRYLIDGTTFSMSLILPIVLILLFGILTIFNIRRSQNRVHAFAASHFGNSAVQPTLLFTEQQQQHYEKAKQKKKTDRSLFKMLIIQSIFLTLFTLPLVLERIYSMFIRPQKTPLEAAVDNVVYNIALLLNYLTNGMPFYIYTLFGGSLFRRALFDLFKTIGQRFRY